MSISFYKLELTYKKENYPRVRIGSPCPKRIREGEDVQLPSFECLLYALPRESLLLSLELVVA